MRKDISWTRNGAVVCALAFVIAPMLARCDPAEASTTTDGVSVQTEDVDLFYRVYENAHGHPTAEQLQHEYLDQGSEGLHRFARLRNISGERSAATTATNPSLYADAKLCLAVLSWARKRLETALHTLGNLYVAARLPSITFAIGRGKPVAVGAPETGIQVGLEALCAIDWLNPDVEDRIV